MSTIRTFTMAFSVMAGLAAITLPALAQEAYNVDCETAATGQVSALVWDMGSETFVARVVDIRPAAVAPAKFTSAIPAMSGPDANVLLDESLIGASTDGTAARLDLASGS